MTTRRLDDLGTSTTLASNKSRQSYRPTVHAHSRHQSMSRETVVERSPRRSWRAWQGKSASHPRARCQPSLAGERLVPMGSTAARWRQSWDLPPWQAPSTASYFSSSCEGGHTMKEKCMRSLSVSLTLVGLVVGLSLVPHALARTGSGAFIPSTHGSMPRSSRSKRRGSRSFGRPMAPPMRWCSTPCGGSVTRWNVNTWRTRVYHGNG